MIASCSSRWRANGNFSGRYFGRAVDQIYLGLYDNSISSFAAMAMASIPASDPTKGKRRDFLSAARASQFCWANIAGIAA